MPSAREQLLRELEEEGRRSDAAGVLFLQAVAERSGMNLTDLLCITILASTGPVTAGRLAEMTGLTTGAITGVVNRLERAGYVRREKDPADARRVVIQPVTEELERVGAGIFGSQESVMDELFSDYDDRDLAIFLELMRKSNNITQDATARLRASSKGEDGGEFATPLGSVKQGRLVFANGISRLSLRSASGMGDLYQASFRGPAPETKVEAGTVTFRYHMRLRGLLDWRDRSGHVTINDAVPWEVEVRGGAYRIEADLGGARVISFALNGGFSDCILVLSEPSGVVPVRLSGGANRVSIRRPERTEARLNVRGGISKLTFDDQHFEAIGGKLRLQTPGCERAGDRFEIEISGGANEISIL